MKALEHSGAFLLSNLRFMEVITVENMNDKAYGILYAMSQKTEDSDELWALDRAMFLLSDTTDEEVSFWKQENLAYSMDLLRYQQGKGERPVWDRPVIRH